MTSAAKVLLPSAFGVLMVGAAGHRADGVALAVMGAALVAVVVGAKIQPAATVAVLLTVATAVLATPAPMFAALAGLAATAYLVLRHGSGTAPTMIAAVGFAAVAALAIAVPVEIAWLPLAAPLVLLAGYLLTLRPFLSDTRASEP